MLAGSRGSGGPISRTHHPTGRQVRHRGVSWPIPGDILLVYNPKNKHVMPATNMNRAACPSPDGCSPQDANTPHFLGFSSPGKTSPTLNWSQVSPPEQNKNPSPKPQDLLPGWGGWEVGYVCRGKGFFTGSSTVFLA